MVKRKFGMVSKSLKILCPSLSEKFYSDFYIFINNSNCEKQGFFNRKLNYLSKKASWTQIESLSIPNLKTNFSSFLKLS